MFISLKFKELDLLKFYFQTKKKELESKDREVNQKLDAALKITQRVETLKDSTASSYYNFADDIGFDEARIMAAN